MDQGKLSNRSSRNNASQSASRSESAAVSASARTSKKPVLFVAAVSKKPVLFVAAVVMILLVSFQYHQCLCPSHPPAPCPAIKAGGSNEENEANKKIVIDAVKGWEDGIDFEVDHHTRWTKGEMDITKKGWFKYERETKLKGLPIEIHQKNICKLFHNTYGSDKVKVLLDHGAGPFTNLGTRFNCDYEGLLPLSREWSTAKLLRWTPFLRGTMRSSQTAESLTLFVLATVLPKSSPNALVSTLLILPLS